MAREKKNESENLNLASLLDALTNVVGILAFIVILVVISVADKTDRFAKDRIEKELQDDPVLSTMPADLDFIKGFLAEVGVNYVKGDPSRKNNDSPRPVTRDDVERLKRELLALSSSPGLVLPNEWTIGELRDIKILVETVSQDLALLEKAKAISPAHPSIPYSRDILVPDPRPVSKSKTPIFFVCQRDRIYPFDAGFLSRVFKRSIQDMLRVESGESIKIPATEFRKVAEYFHDVDVGDRYIHIVADYLPGSLALTFEPRRTDQGETADKVAAGSSTFSRMLSGYSSEKHYVKFLVWGDSFPVYLEARKVADSQGFQANWTPYAADEPFREIIGGERGERRSELVD